MYCSAIRGIGPFAIKVLESEYSFDSAVKFVEFPASMPDVHFSLLGADVVILITEANVGGQPGDIRLFRKHEMPSIPAPFRNDAPTAECVPGLQRVDALSGGLLLIGMQGCRFNPGLQLSRPVRDCIAHVIDAVLRELRRLGVWCSPKPKPARQGVLVGSHPQSGVIPPLILPRSRSLVN